MSEREQEETRDNRVHEVELAADGDHSTHEGTITVLVVASSMREAQIRAGNVVQDAEPEFPIDGVTALHCGSTSLDDDVAEYHGELGRQPDVIIGPEVPV